MIDLPILRRSCRLPRGALSLLVALHRKEVELATITILDRDMPGQHARGAFVGHAGGDVHGMLMRVVSLLQPALGSVVITTVQPDVMDSVEYPPEVVERHYLADVHAVAGWRVNFKPVPRLDWLPLLQQPAVDVDRLTVQYGAPSAAVHLVFTTDDEHLYRSVSLTVNPKASSTLSVLPRVFPPRLFDLMSWAGRSERIAVVPRNSRLLSTGVIGDEPHLRRPFSTPDGTTVSEALAALARLWIPDTSALVPPEPLTRPLGVWTGTAGAAGANGLPPGTPFTAPGVWNDPTHLKALDGERFAALLRSPRTVAVVVADGSSGDWGGIDAHFILANGRSGAKGGF